VISIPIVSEFDGKGISNAVQQFKQLEGAGAKAQFAIKKAAVPAAAALGGLAVALGDAVKGAMEDAAAQAQLALSITNSTGATDKQIAALEDWISAQGRLLGVTDDELRPALAKLARQTASIEEAQAGVTLAMNISAATGKSLETVTTALEKAYGGQVGALAKLDPSLKGLIKDGMSAGEAMGILDAKFTGAAETAANSAEGGFKRLGVTLSETKESIGAALLPVVEAILPKLQGMASWAQDNPGKFTAIAAVIGTVATAIIAANVAMGIWSTITAVTTALNTALAASFTAVQVASGLIVFTAIIAGLVLAYNKFAWFRDGVKAVFKFLGDAIGVWVDAIKTEFNVLSTVFKVLFNGVAWLWNNTVGKLSFKVPDWVPVIGGKGFNVPDIPMLSFGGGGDSGGGGGGAKIPMMAEGGIVTSPTLAIIGEAGPEAVIPLSKMKQMGNNVTIHVNGGDPNAVVAALRTYMRQNGSVPIKVGNAY
jgi:hypothetical protein